MSFSFTIPYRTSELQSNNYPFMAATAARLQPFPQPHFPNYPVYRSQIVPANVQNGNTQNYYEVPHPRMIMMRILQSPLIIRLLAYFILTQSLINNLLMRHRYLLEMKRREQITWSHYCMMINSSNQLPKPPVPTITPTPNNNPQEKAVVIPFDIQEDLSQSLDFLIIENDRLKYDEKLLVQTSQKDRGLALVLKEIIAHINKSSPKSLLMGLRALNSSIQNRRYLRQKISTSYNNATIIERFKKTLKIRRQKQNSRASQYRGVSKNGKKWQLFIVINVRGKKRYLGRFPSQELAARFYDKASIQFNGIKAKTNFSYTAMECLEILNGVDVIEETRPFRKYFEQVDDYCYNNGENYFDNDDDNEDHKENILHRNKRNLGRLVSQTCVTDNSPLIKHRDSNVKFSQSLFRGSLFKSEQQQQQQQEQQICKDEERVDNADGFPQQKFHCSKFGSSHCKFLEKTISQ